MQDQFLCILCIFCIPIPTNLLGASAKQDICPFYEDGIRTAAKNYWQNLFLPFLFLFPNVSNKCFIFSVPCVVHVNEELQKRYLFFFPCYLYCEQLRRKMLNSRSPRRIGASSALEIYMDIYFPYFIFPHQVSKPANTLFFYAAYRHCDVF